MYFYLLRVHLVGYGIANTRFELLFSQYRDIFPNRSNNLSP